MKHIDYSNFFKDRAVHHKKLHHLRDDGKSAFSTIIESGQNPFQAKSDIDNFLSSIRTTGKFPHLLLITFDANYNGVKDSFCKKIIEGAFIILDKPKGKRDYDEINDTLNSTEIIGEQILAALNAFAEENECTLFSGEGTGVEKLGPIGDGFFGSKFYVKIEANANYLLTDNRNDATIWD